MHEGRQSVAFWTYSAEELLACLNSSEHGLTQSVAEKRLAGAQRRRARKRSSWALLVDQFKSPIILLLAFSAVLSFALPGEQTNAWIIVFSLLASGLLGYWQEASAADAVAELIRVLETKATVIRDGQEREIALDEVVPGDVIRLRAGGLIPGNCRLMTARDLFVNEAALTGASFPAEKTTSIVVQNAGLRERVNSLFLGTHVVSGTGTAIVVSTGRDTEFGKISERLQQNAPETGFERGLRHFGQLLVKVVVVITAVVFAIKVGWQGKPIVDSLLVGLAAGEHTVGFVAPPLKLMIIVLGITVLYGVGMEATKRLFYRYLAGQANAANIPILLRSGTAIALQLPSARLSGQSTFARKPMTTVSATSTDFIRWFDQVGMQDVGLVGGKNASLGEMYQQLTPRGIRVPNGFATTADAYRGFLVDSGLDDKISQLLSGMNVTDVGSLQHHGSLIRHMILDTPLPDALARSIVKAYHQLCEDRHDLVDVAVRSSATAEDLPDASFAGQQETYLNVRGQASVLDACRRCIASLFTDRAISYRAHHGFDHMRVALSIGIQRMVRSDLATSGVMFSIDTESGFKDVVLINAAYGLGENVVQGSVNPDEYYVFKPTLKAGFRPILKKMLGSKAMKLVYDAGGNKMTKNVPVGPDQANRFALSDDDILQLARWACDIEDHYSQLRGQPCPMDMEWAKDGRTGELFIVQARPETVQSRKSLTVHERYHLQERSAKLLTGRSIGEKISSGPVRFIHDVHVLDAFREGEILVTNKTDPDWEPVMKRAAGVITNQGGRTCHAAIVSRELGLPAIVGTLNATEVLKDGQTVTISCADGDEGVVYEGALPFKVETMNLTELRRPRTKIMMNVGSPDDAFTLSAIPNDGVGLAREEFIISTYVKVHPQALLDYYKLAATTRAEVDRATIGYDDKPQFYIDRLAEGIAMIAAAFYPKDVIVRLSDFKTNEYSNLIGGAAYEPKEENPMLGFRGASRYYSLQFRDAFGLECKAVQKVRQEMGLRNLKLMIPFCRTVEEGRKVQAEMAKYNLVRGQDELEIYVMCEIPSNVILADQFAEIFDGFSIGSNDLTQLTLGVDRDSAIVAHVFDENNEAVKRLISSVIGTAKAKGTKIGICGQAPSDYPEFAAFLVKAGIDSMSLTPDAIVKTTMHVLEIEKACNP